MDMTQLIVCMDLLSVLHTLPLGNRLNGFIRFE